MASIANTRATAGSILGAVSTIATTVSSTFDAANQAIGMLNTTVSDASYRQKKRSEYDMAIFEITLKEEKEKELAISRKEIGKWMSEDSVNESLFQKASLDLEAAILRRKA